MRCSPRCWTATQLSGRARGGEAGPETRKEIHSNYAARFEGLNDAFAVLRQSEPGITTKIDVEQYRKDAERYVEQQAGCVRFYEESVSGRITNRLAVSYCPAGNGSGFSY